MRIHLDFETRCKVDLKKHGLRRYCGHDSFEITLTAFSIDDGPDIYQIEGPPDQELMRLLHDADIHAFNAAFEIEALRAYGFNIGMDRWHDTMVHAYSRGFSSTLAKVGEQVGLPEDQQKLKDGGRLIGKFCKTRRPSKANPDLWWTSESAPEDWERFKLYNRLDVVAERGIWTYLNRRFPETPEDRAEWVLDRQINDRGLGVDTRLVKNALLLTEVMQDDITEEVKALTGGIRPSQTSAMLKWCQDQGYDRSTLRAEDVRGFLNEHA